MNNIILIGYRGVGKSTIGKALSIKTGKSYYSLDNLLAEKIGPLQDFIREFGLERFRNEESELISNININDSILDCGGGVVERESNMLTLQKKGFIIYLKASVDVIKKRLSLTNPRLSLSGSKTFTDEIVDVLSRREPLYIKYSNYVINTDDLTVEESVEHIVRVISDKINIGK